MKTETIREYYIPVWDDNRSGVTDIEVSLYYSVGGFNVFTYKEEKRGYYISCIPVERKRGMESFVAFSGFKRCLVECKRKSKAKETEAVRLFEEWTNEKIMRCFPELTEIDALPF